MSLPGAPIFSRHMAAPPLRGTGGAGQCLPSLLLPRQSLSASHPGPTQPSSCPSRRPSWEAVCVDAGNCLVDATAGVSPCSEHRRGRYKDVQGNDHPLSIHKPSQAPPASQAPFWVLGVRGSESPRRTGQGAHTEVKIVRNDQRGDDLCLEGPGLKWDKGFPGGREIAC